MKIHSIWDNGGKTFDRYTAVYDKMDGQYNLMVGMSEHPFHPCGFGIHDSCLPGDHLGKQIKFEELPPDCQRCVAQDLEET